MSSFHDLNSYGHVHQVVSSTLAKVPSYVDYKFASNEDLSVGARKHVEFRQSDLDLRPKAMTFSHQSAHGSDRSLLSFQRRELSDPGASFAPLSRDAAQSMRIDADGQEVMLASSTFCLAYSKS